jgi:hypothetical protein
MPQYYSLGDVTLALGSFVESFGNSVYESLGCGTPSIPARISSHRELLPEHLIDKVDFNDIESAARIAAEIIQSKRRTSAETMAYLHEHYSVHQQRAAYADVILNASQRGGLQYVHPTLNAETRYKLPIWCYPSQTRGIYHDFRMDYFQSETFNALIAAYPHGFTIAEALTHDIDQDQIETWYREGYLTPVS